jgi:hypothetical protein
MAPRKGSRPRDPLYEEPGGRLARPEIVAARRWAHERFAGTLIDPDGDPLTGSRQGGDTESLDGRFRYYECIQDGIISKQMAQEVESTKGGTVVTKGDRVFTAALTWLRERGLVPDSWITDGTRHVEDYTGYDTVEAAIRGMVGNVLLDPWKGRWPLLLVESQASASALEIVGAECRIPLAALRGQASRSFLANTLKPFLFDGQTVLVIVDLDKVGGDIADSARRRLEELHGITFDWRHLALTDDQVTEHNIVKVPRLDKRDSETRMVAEVEALGANTLRQIVRDALDDLLPEKLVSVRARERVERAALLAKLNTHERGVMSAHEPEHPLSVIE